MLQTTPQFGPSPRVANFLLSLLQPATQQRYATALNAFNEYVNERKLPFSSLTEEQQDYALCDYVMDAMDAETSLQYCTDLVAALQKQYGGRRRFKAASATIDGWRQSRPVNMAEPMPEEVCYAMVSLIFMANRRPAALTLLLCFVGVMRVGEVLNLRMSDVLAPSQHKYGYCLILVLRTAKRAAPDSSKIFIWHPRVVAFVLRYITWRGAAPDERFVPVSYNTVSRWISRASVALGFPADTWRSHSMRRGAATTLSLRGLSIPQVMEAGRWLSERSARLYIHKGSVALLRLKSRLTDNQWAQILRLACLGEFLFDLP